MSDETTLEGAIQSGQVALTEPYVQAPSLGDHYIEIPEFTCDFPGCDVKKDTQRKLNAHKGQAHKRHAVKKEAAKVAPTVVDEEKLVETHHWNQSGSERGLVQWNWSGLDD